MKCRSSIYRYIILLKGMRGSEKRWILGMIYFLLYNDNASSVPGHAQPVMVFSNNQFRYKRNDLTAIEPRLLIQQYTQKN